VTTDRLTAEELGQLVRRVFEPGPEDRALAILVDLPDDRVEDNPAWRARRRIAFGWFDELRAAGGDLGIEPSLFVYRNVHSNNADLPGTAWRCSGGEPPDNVLELSDQPAEPMGEVLGSHQLVLAPTEFSTTAPLKMLAPRHGFRAATMPGFSADMVPALRLDYTEVNRRVHLFKDLLDEAAGADFHFEVQDGEDCRLHLDLRHRSAHASGGLLPSPGSAGNLPSGEAYIVPYEGEIDSDPTASGGRLPVQFGDEVVVFEIEQNRAVRIVSSGPESLAEAERLAAEPARGNLAELGLGVLADFGVRPIGVVLLDEKLGLHLAFGRSEHFGGQVGPAQFSSPEQVMHQDHVYLEELQPKVKVVSAALTMADGSVRELMRDGRYAIDFSSTA
jgi:hypothetical protein